MEADKKGVGIHCEIVDATFPAFQPKPFLFLCEDDDEDEDEDEEEDFGGVVGGVSISSFVASRSFPSSNKMATW